jgi:hypothetical protein
VRSSVLAAFVVIALPSVAAGDAPKVDWARGLVIADAVGVANRHAPNPAVARGTSRRGAEEAARKVLAAKVAELPVAGGGTVASKAKKDEAVKTRVAAAVAAAITIDAAPETDGAWRVTMAVPIEAVRQALDGGARQLAADADKGAIVTIVEGMKAKPAVGALAAPTIWVTEVPAWAKDAPKVDAKGLNPAAQTLYVVVTK